jgi:uncharacterized RDD family membrane protein YckC
MDYQNYSAPDQSGSDLFAAEPVVYGSFWERFAAYFIDSLILIIPNVFFTYGMGGVGNLLSIAMSWLYFALQESGQTQATLGKKAMGLKVINEQGQQISFGQASGRHFGRILSALILCIGYLMMLWDPKKQTLHDKMANTYVAKR